MKHCKRFFSFLAALALLLFLSLPSLSMAESGQAEDGARSPVEASVEHAAEDADPWEEAEPRGDGEEAPAPVYPALQEDADDANDAPSAAFPAFPEEAEDAESTAEADPTEFATLSEEDEPAGAEADPAEAQLPELSETDGPAGDEADPAEAPAPEDAALSEADAPHWDDDGEAPPPEFPGLWEEPETDAALVAEGELLRLTADTRWNSLDNIHVVVEADAGVLPPDTLLRAAAVKDPDILRRAREAVESADRRVALVQALELGFFGPDGAALEPEGPVRVTLYSYRAARFRELELVSVLDDWTDVVETTQNLASLGFAVYESGVYAIVGTEAVVFEHLSARGGAASVTVSYDPERFGFLRDASLEVRELEGEELERYLAAAAEALAAVDKDPDEPEAPDESEGRDEPEDPGEAGEEAGRGLAWARFFDVRLTAPDGTEYHELGGDVRVTVTLDEPLEVPEDCALYAVHFADGPEAPPELTEAALNEDGTELSFTQSGFSATGTVLMGAYVSGSRWWPEVWHNEHLYVVTENWLPYVVLVREPESGNPDPKRPFYMLEVDTSTEHVDEVSSTRTYTRYRVKLVEANVKEEADGTLSLCFDDKPEEGVYYSSFEDIDQWIWFHHQYGGTGYSSSRKGNNLVNAATGCLLGTAVVTNRPSTTEYCAGTVSVEEGQYPNDAFYLEFPGFGSDDRYTRRLYSQNSLKNPGNKYVWYFMKDEDYLKGVTNKKEYSATNSVNAPDRLPPDGVLEFYFASEIRINGQEILRPATFPYDPDAVNSYGSGDNAYKAEDPYGDTNPYSFHTYADNPDNDALPPSITPDPPAAKKTLTPQGDGSYELSLSVTADAGENAMPDASAEVVLVVDVSESMDNPKNNPDVRPAIAQEREVLLQIGKMLKEKQVPFHVILFSTGAWTDGKTYTAQNYGEFEVMVNGLTTRLGGATCWEAALHLAGRVLKQIDAAEVASTDVNYKDKYVMFISDGKPNLHVRDTVVQIQPYQITEFDQSFGGKRVSGWGYKEGQSETGNSGVEIQMRPLLLEQKLVAAGANVINVFIQSNEKDGIGPKWMKRMSNIAYAGGIYTQEPPAGTYYWADAANEGEIAGELISATRFILRKFLYQDVSLTDGLTEGTALAGTTGLAPEGAVPDFSYTITLKNGTEYIGEFPAGETTALRFCRNTDDGIKYLAADGSETANAEEALLLGKAEYNGSTRTVNWDIKPPNAEDGAHYTLIEDATYTVSFPVWPTQETYDAISGRENNGSDIELPQGLYPLEEYNYTFASDTPPTSLSDLLAFLNISGADVDSVKSGDPEGISVTEASPGNWTLAVAAGLDRTIPLTITLKDGSVLVVNMSGSAEASAEKLERHWKLSTNTKGTAVNYKPQLRIQENGEPPEWRNFPSSREEIENPDPVELAAWTVNARKVWMDSGTEHSDIDRLTLHLLQGGTDYIGEIELTGTGGWLSADFSISPGMMVRRTEETESWGKAVTFDGEPYVLLNEGYSYHFTETLPNSLYPFRLEEDSFYPMLVDGVPVNAQRVTVGESYAYTDVGRLVKPLLAKNRLADAISIEITKQVLDAQGQRVQADGQENGQEENVEFHLTVTLTAPGGELNGFPLLNGDRIVRFGVLDREGANVTAERFPEGNYLTFNETGVAVGDFPIRDGETVFFPSVPEGTRYKVEEPETSMPEGYVLREIACFIRDADTGDLTAGAANENGYLAQRDQNQVVVTNQIRVEDEKPILPRIVIDKFQTGDNTQKLSGAAFVLYRYPSAEELEADETLGAETPLYYCRPDPDEPPTFTPDKDQALTVITDADGRAEFTDLPDGVYYLLETEAPIDYHRLIAPIAVTVDTSWLETAENPTQAQIAAASVFTVHIANTPKTTLPATGGPGPARQAGLAPLLLGVGAAGLVILRRKRKTAGR
ncbi:MAG: VWA domain-containing protein [Oscillospiraceae bacterium]|nr:VWA domain-containing protein [Oscillospiraceae bacterium]